MRRVADELNRRTRLWQGAALVSTFDRFVMPPMLVAVAHELGVPLSDIVSAVAAYFVAYGLGQPVWGYAAHRFGVVRTARIALVIAGLLSLVSALAWSALSLGIIRGLAGGFYGSAFPSGLIYLGESVPARSRQSHIARLLVGVALGTSLGTLIGGVVADHWSWRWAFLLPGLAAVTLGWFLGRVPEPVERGTAPPVRTELRTMARLPVLYALGLFTFVEGGLVLGGLTLMPTALAHAGYGLTVAGGLTASYGVAVLIFAQLVRRFSPRLHPAVMIVIGGVSATFGLLVFGLWDGIVPAIVSATLFGAAWSFMQTTFQTWATEILPRGRALVISAMTTCLFAGTALQAVVIRGPADHGQFDAVYLTMAVVAIALTACSALARLRWQRSPESESPS